MAIISAHMLCIGFKKDPKNKNHLLIDRNVADNIHLIYDLYEKGYGAGRIANYLNDKGIACPSKYKRSLGYHIPSKFKTEIWYDSTVLKILKNQMYIGNMVQGYTSKISYKINKFRQLPVEERVIVKGTHKAIIQPEQFWHVQELMKQRRCSGNGKAVPHIFTGKIKCADCGLSMYKKKVKERIYFRCKTNSLAKNKCSSHNISYSTLEEVVTEKISNYLKQYGDMEHVIENISVKNEMVRKRRMLDKEHKTVSKELQKKQQLFKELYLDKVNGILSVEQFNCLSQTFEKENSLLKKRLSELENQMEFMDNDDTLEKKKQALISKYKDFKELNYEMVQQLIDYIEVKEKNQKSGEQEIIIHWLF